MKDRARSLRLQTVLGCLDFLRYGGLITRCRLAGDPADAMVTPQLADLGLVQSRQRRD